MTIGNVKGAPANASVLTLRPAGTATISNPPYLQIELGNADEVVAVSPPFVPGVDTIVQGGGFYFTISYTATKTHFIDRAVLKANGTSAYEVMFTMSVSCVAGDRLSVDLDVDMFRLYSSGPKGWYVTRPYPMRRNQCLPIRQSITLSYAKP